MPALVKAVSKKASKDATQKLAKPLQTAPTKRKQPFREEPEVETELKDELKKKLKGKERAQDDGEPVSKAIKGMRESAAKEKVEVREKDRRPHEKVDEKKASAHKAKVSEAPKGNTKGTVEKEKAQNDEQLASKAVKGRKESATKEKVEVRVKDRRPHEKVEEKKAKADKSKVSEAPKGNTRGTVKRKKAPTPSPEPSEASDDEVDEDDTENSAESADESDEEDGTDKSSDEDEALLHGLSSESDSSDEDDDNVDAAPIDIGKLPTIAKDDATVKRKLEKAKKQPTEDRGVLYLGRIPHGFYEDQMKSYFSQFGDVTRLRLSRNKKTGRSKHYAFIEFKSAAVAQIVAETMNNYLLMGRLLQCKVIPKEEVHPELWIGANRKFRKVPTARIERLHQNKERTHEEKRGAERRLLKRQRQKKRKLEVLGIDYDFEPVYSKKTKRKK